MIQQTEQEMSHTHTRCIFSCQDKKDFVDKRVKRLLKAGVTSALAVMVKAENIILTDQTKEMLARCERKKKKKRLMRRNKICKTTSCDVCSLEGNSSLVTAE